MKRLVAILVILLIGVYGYQNLSKNTVEVFAKPQQLSERALYGYDHIEFEYDVIKEKFFGESIHEDFKSKLNEAVFQHDLLKELDPTVIIMTHNSQKSDEQLQHIQIVYESDYYVLSAYELEPTWPMAAFIDSLDQKEDHFGNVMEVTDVNGVHVSQIFRGNIGGMQEYYRVQEDKIFLVGTGGHEIFYIHDNVLYSLMYTSDHHEAAYELLLSFGNLEK